MVTTTICQSSAKLREELEAEDRKLLVQAKEMVSRNATSLEPQGFKLSDFAEVEILRRRDRRCKACKFER